MVLARRAVCALSLALLLGAPPARADPERLAITAESDPVAGQPNGIDYEYDTAGPEMNLTIVSRPASGPPCAATAGVDAANVGSGGSTYVTPTPIELKGQGLGRVPFTFASAGPQRICAWLARTPDDVAAAAVADADVRLPRAALAVTAAERGAKAGGADVLVHVSGTAEAPADLYLSVVPGGSACPPTFDEDSDPVTLAVNPAGTATRVSGSFELDYATSALLSFRSWRICGYLQDGSTATAASTTATTLVDLVLRPALLSRPRVRRKGTAIACDGGRWRARPAARYAYAWLVGTRKVPGATGRRLAVTAAMRGRAIRCRVTATNRLGRTSATSKPVVAR
jgi:hypothetical protein